MSYIWDPVKAANNLKKTASALLMLWVFWKTNWLWFVKMLSIMRKNVSSQLEWTIWGDL